jgi:hypothetical protein
MKSIKITVDGVNFNQSIYRICWVVDELEKLKSNGMVEGGLTIKKEYRRLVLKLGKALGYKDPNGKQIECIIESLNCPSNAQDNREPGKANHD